MRALLLMLTVGLVLGATPSVTITSPADGARIGPSASLSFTLSDWDVELYGPHLHWFLDGELQGMHTSTDPISMEGLSPGAHTITVDLRDDTHAPIGVSDTISVTVVDDEPSVVITSPADGAYIGPGASIAFTVSNWEIAPGGPHLHWFLDGEQQGMHYSTDAISVEGLAPGAHTITVDLRDDAHAPIGVSDTISVTVVDEQPSLVITSPADGALLQGPTLVTFTVDDWELSSGGRHAHWFLDGVDQGPLYDTDPFLLDALPPGAHSLRIDLREDDHTSIGVAASVQFQAAASPRLVGRRIAGGFDRPVWATHAPGEPDRLYVCEQHTGLVRVLDLRSGQIAAEPFLELAPVATGGEQGLLGLAFHPDYARNRLVVSSSSDADGDTRVLAHDMDAGTSTPVLSLEQPQVNHNGGWIGFGPDGMLYIALGDGGGSDDEGDGHVPGGNAQSLANLYGSILRIDIDGGDPYAIPGDNPHVDDPAARGEIWVHGLRNPWRCAFDAETTAFWIGDVGQRAREEIDVVPAGLIGGDNFGWPRREGLLAGPQPDPSGGPVVDPVWEYDRSVGQAVTGGFVYRGPVPVLVGHYCFADFISGRVWHAAADERPFQAVSEITDIFSGGEADLDNPASFARDALGHLYVLDLDGDIFRVEPAQPRHVHISVQPSSAQTLLATDDYESLALADTGALFDWRDASRDLSIDFSAAMAIAAASSP